ncbi:hypothetical protein J2T60_002586 [Natronospira proteinivora]|uniref:Uncharacterized protein n=1 Tax=Natronospira proteinivora TaxID=1807133 RepID=A0ABT1GF45_9GAMM|nr:hypothetical protein [Natronospira proteinivora]
MVRIVPWISAIVLAFIAGYGISGYLGSKPMTLYVSVPGEYSVYAPGGNTIHAFTVLGQIENKIDCRYFDTREKYDAVVTYDVLLGKKNVTPNCYASFQSR